MRLLCGPLEVGKVGEGKSSAAVPPQRKLKHLKKRRRLVSLKTRSRCNPLIHGHHPGRQALGLPHDQARCIVVLVLIVAVGIAVPVALLTGGSDGDPSPPPSPGRPPPSLLSSSVVSFDVVASGIVSDYGDAKKAALAQAVATKTGVDASSVTVSVVAASVRIAIELTASDTAIQDGSIMSSLATEFIDAATASAFLGVTVQSPPATFSTSIATSSSSFAAYVLYTSCRRCCRRRRRRRHRRRYVAAVTVAASGAAVAAAVSAVAGNPRSRRSLQSP